MRAEQGPKICQLWASLYNHHYTSDTTSPFQYNSFSFASKSITLRILRLLYQSAIILTIWEHVQSLSESTNHLRFMKKSFCFVIFEGLLMLNLPCITKQQVGYSFWNHNELQYSDFLKTSFDRLYNTSNILRKVNFGSLSSFLHPWCVQASHVT